MELGSFDGRDWLGRVHHPVITVLVTIVRAAFNRKLPNWSNNNCNRNWWNNWFQCMHIFWCYSHSVATDNLFQKCTHGSMINIIEISSEVCICWLFLVDICISSPRIWTLKIHCLPLIWGAIMWGRASEEEGIYLFTLCKNKFLFQNVISQCAKG